MFDEIDLNHLLVAVQEKLCELRTLRGIGKAGLDDEISSYEALELKIAESLE
jgi:hypothetical protein